MRRNRRNSTRPSRRKHPNSFTSKAPMAACLSQERAEPSSRSCRHTGPARFNMHAVRMRKGRRDNVIKGRFGRRRGSNWTKPRAYGYARKTGLGNWKTYLPLWGGAALLGTAVGGGWFGGILDTGEAQAAYGGTSGRMAFDYCHVGGGYNCVVDGDTIWLRGQKIRIADIDAPETHDYRCPSEQELGNRATKRLHALLEGGSITLEPIDRDEDRYGRKLRRVLVDGRNVGDTLVSEGLAREYGAGRQPWC